MMEVRQTAVFERWLRGLDASARARVVVRLRRFEAGNPGEIRNLADDLSEMKIDFGPGYRIYFTRVGQVVVMLLCGGDKRTQQKDIARARQLAEEL